MPVYLTPEESKEFIAEQAALYEAGKITHQQYQAAMRDGLKGVIGYSQAMTQVKGTLVKGALDFAESMADGAQGASAFNGAIDSAIAALTLLITVVNPLAGIFAAMAIAGLTYTKKVNEQADALYKANQDLAKAGAVGAGGMTEIYGNLKKLSYGTEELSKMTALLTEQGQNLAMFGGTAFTGARRLADVSNQLKPMQNQFMNMGLSVDDINKGIAGYLSLQTKLGNTQNQSTASLAKESADYLKNMSTLSKLTGESADSLQKKKEESLAINQFYASIEDLPKEQKELQLQKFAYIQNKLGQEAAVGFAKMASGMASGEEVQKINQATGFAMGRVARNFTQPIESMAVDLQGGIASAHSFNRSAAMFDGGVIDYYKFIQYQKQDTNTLRNSFKEAKEATDNAAAGADATTDAQSKLRIQQMHTRDALQNMINKGIKPVTEGLGELSKVINKASGVDTGDNDSDKNIPAPPQNVKPTTAAEKGVKSDVLSKKAQLEEIMGMKLVVTSGVREGAANHGTGDAIDIGLGANKLTQAQTDKLLKAAVDLGFTGIGAEFNAKGGAHIHLDTSHKTLTGWGSDGKSASLDKDSPYLKALIAAKLSGKTAPAAPTTTAGTPSAKPTEAAAPTAPNSGLTVTNPSAQQSTLAENKQIIDREEQQRWDEYKMYKTALIQYKKEIALKGEKHVMSEQQRLALDEKAQAIQRARG